MRCLRLPPLTLMIAAVWLAVPVGVAQAERRVALVIGNSKYKTVSPLTNPINDARLMRDALQKSGFKVTLVTNAGYQRMRKAIINFGLSLKKGGVGLFYYSGHGIQFDGANYMAPIDAKLEVKDYAAVEAVNLNYVLARMGAAKNRMNIVIMDACRNNPFPAFDRSANRGLAVTEVPGGTYIAYSTAPGRVATDGRGRNSPFTKALAEVVSGPGVELDRVFKLVRDRVRKATGGKQLPWSSSSVTGDFYFKAPKAATTTGGNADEGYWSLIKTSTDPKVFQSFLQQYPDSSHAVDARKRLAGLRKDEVTIQKDNISHTRKASATALVNPKIEYDGNWSGIITCGQNNFNSPYFGIAKLVLRGNVVRFLGLGKQISGKLEFIAGDTAKRPGLITVTGSKNDQDYELIGDYGRKIQLGRVDIQDSHLL